VPPAPGTVCTLAVAQPTRGLAGREVQKDAWMLIKMQVEKDPSGSK